MLNLTQTFPLPLCPYNKEAFYTITYRKFIQPHTDSYWPIQNSVYHRVDGLNVCWLILFPVSQEKWWKTRQQQCSFDFEFTWLSCLYQSPVFRAHKWQCAVSHVIQLQPQLCLAFLLMHSTFHKTSQNVSQWVHLFRLNPSLWETWQMPWNSHQGVLRIHRILVFRCFFFFNRVQENVQI